MLLSQSILLDSIIATPPIISLNHLICISNQEKLEQEEPEKIFQKIFKKNLKPKKYSKVTTQIQDQFERHYLSCLLH